MKPNRCSVRRAAASAVSRNEGTAPRASTRVLRMRAAPASPARRDADRRGAHDGQPANRGDGHAEAQAVLRRSSTIRRRNPQRLGP